MEVGRLAFPIGIRELFRGENVKLQGGNSLQEFIKGVSFWTHIITPRQPEVRERNAFRDFRGCRSRNPFFSNLHVSAWIINWHTLLLYTLLCNVICAMHHWFHDPIHWNCLSNIKKTTKQHIHCGNRW